MLKGTYKSVEFNYTPHSDKEEANGILIIKLRNGVESTHIINNWGVTRIFQYIASMEKLV